MIKNGETVDIWNADGGTASEQAYKNVPFSLTDAGYGVFVDQPDRVNFEVGTEVVSRTQFSVEVQALQYYLIYGPSPEQILAKYAALTGRPRPGFRLVVRAVTVDLLHHRLRREDVASFLDGMAEREIPLIDFHFDCFWMRQFHWCDFIWDPAMFPDPPGMPSRLKQKGSGSRSGSIPTSPNVRRCSPRARIWATWCRPPTATSGSGTCGRPEWHWSTSPILMHGTGTPPS